jgi:hypothetical protein
VYLDEPFPAGGGHFGPTCRACKNPIHKHEPATRLDFSNDPDGAKGLTGDYHLACSKPFASIAQAMNSLTRGFNLGR